MPCPWMLRLVLELEEFISMLTLMSMPNYTYFHISLKSNFFFYDLSWHTMCVKVWVFFNEKL